MAMTRLESIAGDGGLGAVAVVDGEENELGDLRVFDVTAIFAPDFLDSPKKAEPAPFRRPKTRVNSPASCQI